MNFIRSAIRFPSFFAASMILYWVWKVVSLFVPNRVLWRQTVFGIWSKLFGRIAGMDVEVIGNPPKAPFLLVSNHLSYVDIPALRIAVDAVFVAKSEIKEWPLAGTIIANMGNIFIDRKNRRDIPCAGEEIVQRLRAHEGVIIFPEGTSTKGESVLPFNSSFLEFAARIDMPVSYASLRYKTPNGSPHPSERICWWDDTTFMAHLWRLFSLQRFSAIVTFGDQPILNSNRKELAAELHTRVESIFVP